MGAQRSGWFGAVLFGIALAMLAAAPALARAGGGQGYGGGGFGGGGDFGGDDGGGLFSLWPLLFLGHGTGSVFLVLIVLYYIFRQMRARGGAPYMYSPSSSYVPAPVPPSALPQAADPQAVEAGVSAIKQRDPNFTESSFLDRAQTAFFKVQQAWMARNQDLARDVMSDALYERHKIQTDQLIANHQIDTLENIVIGHAHITDVKPGGAFDSITVAFSASMVDYTIDERTKEMVSGQRYPTTFTEYWTFIRRADTKTTAGQPSLASTCPSCGAPLHVSGGKCEFCGAFVRTSSGDWVVDTIEQAA